MSEERDYVLGTHDAEIERLGLQHRVWRPRATDAWRRAGFGPGQTLLDLGAGPGYAALDLAEIVGREGKVVAIDRSRRFLDHLATTAAARGLAQIEIHELDLDERPLPAVAADGAWSRWVYAFVREPRRLLERVVERLAPGGALAMHEYVDYRAWRLSPRSAAFETFVDEVIAAWRASGGEPDIGLDLPRWVEALGLDLREARPISERARPGDYLWQWPRAFVESGLDRLVDLGRIDAARAAATLDEFRALERRPGTFMITPTVIEVVARRR